jgi:uncharacterized protein (TIGR02145 family)
MKLTTTTSRTLMAAVFTLLAWAATPLTTQAQLPATSWQTVAPMPTPIAGGASLVFNGKIYVFAGYDDSTALLSMFVYDPTLNTWETLAGPSFGRGEVAAVEINGLFYLAGGYGPNSGGFFTALAETEVFDPSTESWSTLASMPSGRSVVYSGKIGEEFYVMGGWPGTQNTVTKYNVQTGAWSAAPPLPSGRHNTHGACSIGGRIHCIGGKNDVFSEIYNDHYVYDGNTQSWTNAAPLPIQAWGGAIGHTDEYIFHTGGVNAGYGIYTPSYDQCYVYSVANDTWFEWVPMSQKRSMHTSVVLDGYLYVIGGNDEDNNGLSSVERIAVADACADPTACNFDQEGECVFAEPNLDCAGNCLNDCNNNGVCDENEVLGCTYAFACNYNPAATTDDGTCTVAQPNYDCVGNCLLDLNNNGLCDLEEVAGCTNIDAINYNAEATLDDGSCMVTCKGDFDNDGQITINDLLGFLAAYGNQCEGAGCMDPSGCNYDPNATFDLGYCEYPAEFFNCDGSPINDADGDGTPDELEVAGCTDPEAGNYNLEATDDDGSCSYDSGFEPGPWLNPDLDYGTVTDIDGNVYATIVIGNQEWMAENLRTSSFANGELIPHITNDFQWSVLDFGAWCYYENNASYESPDGKLYNWFAAVDLRNVCPTGWHLPSLADYQQLIIFLGGAQTAGGKLKTAGFDFWPNGNVQGSNLSGFSALPTGLRINTIPAVFEDRGFKTAWWNTNEMNVSSGRPISVRWDDASASEANESKKAGLPIRCLKD